MQEPTSVGGLPVLVALDALVVLHGERRAASVVPNDPYFRGQSAVLQNVDESSFQQRRQIVTESQQIYNNISVDFESLTADTLWEASTQLGELFEQLPEVRYLQQEFPGTCLAVPEWLRTRGEVQYGARIYFFDGDGPSTEEILQQNIDAVLDDDQAAFEAYQGRLHGYPDCCIEAFQNRQHRDQSPEWRAVDPLADRVDTVDVSASTGTGIDTFFDDLFAEPDVYAFFTREFFPEPGCSTARARGVEIYDALESVLPKTLVRDYFRFNFGYSYLEARSMEDGQRELPTPGALGREHFYFYLPLETTLGLSRYRDADTHVENPER
jgi:hypothetical protein